MVGPFFIKKNVVGWKGTDKSTRLSKISGLSNILDLGSPFSLLLPRFQAKLPEEQSAHDDRLAVRHRHRIRPRSQDSIPR